MAMRMDTRTTTMTTLTGDRDTELQRTTSRRILRVLLVTAAILLVPAVAMQFTAEVNWGPMDFVIAGALVAGTGLAYELAVRRMRSSRWRTAGGLALAAALLLVWAELAVGIFH
jgi:hypothetical protein